MTQLFVVALKEIRDNLRDKRAFFFALIYGPLLMPLMLVGPMVLGAKTGFIDYDATSNIYMTGQEHAPNLVQYLRKNNLEAIAAPADYKQQIMDGAINVVLEISPEFGDQLRQGKRGALILYVNHSSKDSQKAATQVRNIINTYSSHLGYWRLRARGVDAEINAPINLVEQDLSSEGLSGMVFGFIVYFLIVFTMMTGGFYLAVDITAGERERNSLEPLLSLPVNRFTLVLGKFLAVLLFVLTSGCTSVISLYLLFTFLPFEELSMVISVNGFSLITAFLVALPCAFLISGLLVATSAYTKSTKEAQTYIGILYIIPMVPMLIGQFADLKASGALLVVPLFSQYALIDKIIKSETIDSASYLMSAGGTLLLAGVFFFLALWLYRHERILSSA